MATYTRIAEDARQMAEETADFAVKGRRTGDDLVALAMAGVAAGYAADAWDAAEQDHGAIPAARGATDAAIAAMQAAGADPDAAAISSIWMAADDGDAREAAELLRAVSTKAGSEYRIRNAAQLVG